MSRHLTLWVVGAAALGWLLAATLAEPNWAVAAQPPALYELVLLLKALFLSALKMIIAPVIFFSLIAGVIGLGDATRLRSLGGTTLAYFLSTTGIAIFIGLTVVTFIHPWEQLSLETLPRADVQPERLIDPSSSSLTDLFRALFQQAFVNPFSALADLNILGIVTNALLFGIGILLATPPDSHLRRTINDIVAVLYRVLGWIMWILPVGVFAVVFELTLANADIVGNLLPFMAVVFGATLFHGLIVLPLIAWSIGRVPPWRLFPRIAKPMLVAFATSSSSATLPVSLTTAQKDLGVSRSVSTFVIPLGATMNMDGTALFEGIAAVFLANLFGIELSTEGMVAVFLMAMISSIGAPGVPSGSMAAMQMVMLAVGIPLEAIGILLLVERPLDTFRTAVNVEGDLIGSIVVQRFTGISDGDAVSPTP